MEQTLSLPWLLLATPQLSDPNFAKSVVLIVESSATGSMGFVINRPMQAPLATLVDAPSMPHGHGKTLEIPKEIPAWYGGPVGHGTGIILHNRPPARPPSAEDDETAFKLNDRIFLSSANDVLLDLVQHETARLATPGESAAMHAYRFIVGYAGWGAGQLEEELRQGAWIQAPLSDELLFSTSWTRLWDAAMAKVGVRPASLAPATQSYLN